MYAAIDLDISYFFPCLAGEWEHWPVFFCRLAALMRERYSPPFPPPPFLTWFPFVVFIYRMLGKKGWGGGIFY